MTDHRPAIAVVRWPGSTPPTVDGVAALLAAYHLLTEAEKGAPVAGVAGLPERYRAEVTDPGAAFAGDVLLVALLGDAAVGCVVVTSPADGQAEIKRLWTDPGFRGRGIASALLDAALARAAEIGADTVRLSVWAWRTGAIALYERLGFTVARSWDERDQLVCMRRAVHEAPGPR
ncbi:GNAT family N-acetyltransferase [Streptomyces sp. NPDC057900]|uniref:GNAT family N-acetyltransferase n=1 Tax=Streptomyces sp. NPDC057900 TaxID=3346274 RepID=UPI0036EF139E